jgi:hypothetical protein
MTDGYTHIPTINLQARQQALEEHCWRNEQSDKGKDQGVILQKLTVLKQLGIPKP